MSSSFEIVTTPTSDTPGTTLVLRSASKHYVFGSLAEGTQRALVQQGTRLLKAQDFFMTGRAEWKNTGGLIGMMLTLADSSTSSYEQSIELYSQALRKGKKPQAPPRPQFNLYGPPNLKHTLGACRRFIFRKGIPIKATEYGKKPLQKDEHGIILPSWQDSNIQVWALSVTPAGQGLNQEAEAELEVRRRRFDADFNAFEDHQAPEQETSEERETRYDRIRTATIKFMFDSNWSLDTLEEKHISEVAMQAALFVRNPHTHGYEPYHGPRPGGPGPIPDIRVFTRTPWPGATILALPPTQPIPECVSYIVRPLPSRGTFDVARAKALGVKPGPDFGKLTVGQSVQNKDGEWIAPDQVIGPDRPGQGIAILDIPSVDYLENTLQREELSSGQVMSGIKAIVWILGPEILGHTALNSFIASRTELQHVISSVDSSPDRIALDSVASQATRLGQIDPVRYSTPVYDNATVPQRDVLRTVPTKAALPPKEAILADRGMSLVLMPRFATKTETITKRFDPDAAKLKTSSHALQLAMQARKALSDDKSSMDVWRQLVARPNTEIITLGTGSALPSKYRNVSATLVRVPGVGNYLLDCGENTLGQLSRLFPADELVDVLLNLRLIWISHLHADHHLGTASVIRAWYHIVHHGVPNLKALNAGSASNEDAYSLAVISHSGMLQWLHEYSSIEDFGYSRILPLQISPYERREPSKLSILNSFTNDQVNDSAIHKQEYEKLFGFSDIQAVKVSHCHGAMAVSITFPPSPADSEKAKPLKVSYSGDCRPSDLFAKIGQDTTVLIHEATFDDELQGDAKAKKHSTTSEALGIGAKMNAKTVVLTHFSQRYQKIPILQTVADGEEEDPLLSATHVAAEDSGLAADEDEDKIDDPTTRTANMDIQAPPSTFYITGNERVIKVRNRDMKVAIAFDYMRVKIGDIIELDKFNYALSELLIAETEIDLAGDEKVNANGKKVSGDEAGGQEKKAKKGKGRRHN